jgi:sugar (pentulose or hexulose) kinase
MTGQRILAIDVGTQSVRAIAFDPDGTLVAGARVPIEPYVSPQPGWAEQDPAVYWEAAVEACAALRAGGFDASSVAALAPTAQRGTVVVSGEDGVPLRPAIVWLDGRRVLDERPVGGLNGLSFRIAGVADTVAAYQADAESNWIRRHEPDTWSRIRHYGLLSAYLAHRLTGRFVDAAAAQVGYLPFDFRRFRWAAPGDWRWTVCGIDPAWLPELVQPGGLLGELTDGAAAALGLAPGLPIVATAGDKACEVLGAGGLKPGVGAVSLGTTATFSSTHRRYVEAIPLVPPYPAAAPGAWNLEVAIYRGFWMVDWFVREFGHPETARAAIAGLPPEALLDELLASTPPGGLGLVAQPTWSPGVRIPGPEAKGSIIGFGDVHTRAHLYRSIVEGLAHALREGAERTASRTGVRFHEIRAAGGGARSEAVLQIVADVFGLPVGVSQTHEASGLGAAVVGAAGAGLHPSVEAAAAAMVRSGAVREPNLDAYAVHDAIHRQVYRPMYARLRPLYEAIRRVTGYPPTPGRGGSDRGRPGPAG